MPLTQAFAHHTGLHVMGRDDRTVGSVKVRFNGEEWIQLALLTPVTNGDRDPSLTTRMSRNPARRSVAVIIDGLANAS